VEIHRHGAHGRFAQMLRHFKDQTVAIVVGFQRVQDFGKRPVELIEITGARDMIEVMQTPILSWRFTSGRHASPRSTPAPDDLRCSSTGRFPKILNALETTTMATV